MTKPENFQLPEVKPDDDSGVGFLLYLARDDIFIITFSIIRNEIHNRIRLRMD